jgi:hypothetical protein
MASPPGRMLNSPLLSDINGSNLQGEWAGMNP